MEPRFKPVTRFHNLRNEPAQMIEDLHLAIINNPTGRRKGFNQSQVVFAVRLREFNFAVLILHKIEAKGLAISSMTLVKACLRRSCLSSPKHCGTHKASQEAAAAKRA
jgi:hypothetical protein